MMWTFNFSGDEGDDRALSGHAKLVWDLAECRAVTHYCNHPEFGLVLLRSGVLREVRGRIVETYAKPLASVEEVAAEVVGWLRDKWAESRRPPVLPVRRRWRLYLDRDGMIGGNPSVLFAAQAEDAYDLFGASDEQRAFAMYWISPGARVRYASPSGEMLPGCVASAVNFSDELAEVLLDNGFRVRASAWSLCPE